MTRNSFGKILTLTTWGESHGKEIGAVLDGVPPNIKITESFIQKFLDKRRPGNSKFVTARINMINKVFHIISSNGLIIDGEVIF